MLVRIKQCYPLDMNVYIYFLSSKIIRELEELLEESSVEATTITTTEGEAELAQAMVCPREGTGPRLLAMELLQVEEEE